MQYAVHMSPSLFHPLVADWFNERFGQPTEAQARGWPKIAAGQHTLIAAPTGSGKTLAAFLVCLDRLARQHFAGQLEDGVQVVYVSPLKALSNDIQRNLEAPLFELRQIAETRGYGGLPIRVAVRTGDTPQAERTAMLRRPPHILVTTPESLYLLLTSEKSRDMLRSCRTVIVDEIHALARDKRGSHLTLTLERLSVLCQKPPVRIGLSATQKPIEQIAKFLVGAGGDVLPQPERNHAPEILQGELFGEDAFEASLFGVGSSTATTVAAPRAVAPEGGYPPAMEPTCEIIDIGHARQLDLALEIPPSELAAVCSNEQWDEIYNRLSELIQTHRSTLVFVNTRRMAERVSHRLTEQLGEDAVASHHGSLSREIRLDAEQRLKAGELKAIVATASLEMGIDIGYIDLVCQVGSPRSIATALQRVGRSGHAVGALPKGRLFPLTRDELLENLALIRAVKRGKLDSIEIPESPLDIVAQQIVATVSADEWNEDKLFELFRRAWPFRNLVRNEYDALLQMLADGIKPGSKAGAYIHRDRINGRLKARRSARLAAITSGGAIPEAAEYNVVLEDGTVVGRVDEHFAVDSRAGNVFLLGNNSWRILAVRGQEVIVADAQGTPPNIPFWAGEAPGRTIELSQELSDLRREIAARVEVSEYASGEIHEAEPRSSDCIDWLKRECNACQSAAEQAARYIAAQKAAIGIVPTCEEIVFERFFDESGGMQLVVHAPLGARINRAWGLALRKRFCRSFDFELQAAADDNGVLLSIGPQHSFPIDSLFGMLTAQNGQELLEQATLAVPMFQIRWRWNATRSLAVLRFSGGKKVPPHLQKFRAEDLLARVFPETVGCLENHHGDIEVPDHPLARQTMHDCLTEAMDITRWLKVLEDVKSQSVQLIPIDTREPSPFSHQLLNAQPYAFLDDADLEDRRTRAVMTRRSLSTDDFRDLARLDPQAIAHVLEEAQPVVRDADELHDTLLTLVVVSSNAAIPWMRWMNELIRAGRATSFTLADGAKFYLAAERLPIVQAVYGDVACDPPVELPEALRTKVESIDGRVEIIRGHMTHGGPITAEALADRLRLASNQVLAALESLEGQGNVMRGKYTPDAQASRDKTYIEWCERRLLARIHRLTLDGLRRRIQPVPPEVYVQFLVRYHRLDGSTQAGGEAGIRMALAQLQGFELPAAVWEEKVLSPRVTNYDPQLLDHLFLSGEAAWGRLKPPKRDEKDGEGLAAATRAVPISLMLREDLGWLVPEDRSSPGSLASGPAKELLAALNARGALFFQDLKALTGLTPQEIEEGLRELAAWGVVTSDTFTAIRAIVRGKKPLSRWEARFGRAMHGASSPIGRWSLFPGVIVPPERDEMLQRWCRQLLNRYGVIFRDVLARESAAPSWFQLAPVLRRMELRGEVRGGRFISGVAGEQFALESVVSQLRDLRDQPPDDSWAIISAGDPLNLSGIVTCGPRIAAMHKNSLVLYQGRCVASKVAGRIEFHAETPAHLQLEIRRALQHGRRITDEELEKTKTPALTGTPGSRWTDRWKARRRFG